MKSEQEENEMRRQREDRKSKDRPTCMLGREEPWKPEKRRKEGTVTNADIYEKIKKEIWRCVANRESEADACVIQNYLSRIHNSKCTNTNRAKRLKLSKIHQGNRGLTYRVRSTELNRRGNRSFCRNKNVKYIKKSNRWHQLCWKERGEGDEPNHYYIKEDESSNANRASTGCPYPIEETT